MTTTRERTTAPSSSWSSPVTSYYLLAFSTALLVLVGIAVVMSSSSITSLEDDKSPFSEFLTQMGHLGLGLILLALANHVSPQWWKRFAPWLMLPAVTLLLLVIAFGSTSGGNTNWLTAGSFSGQPSEAAKLALALFLALTLSAQRRRLVTIKQIMLPSGLAALTLITLVLAGRDLGTAIVMLILVAASMWTAGVPIRFFALGGVVAGFGILILSQVSDSRVARISAWLSDNCDITDECYQSAHGNWALASGGLWGLGPGLSREKWSYLPAAENDFIYAIVGEEYGLVGTIFVLIALAMMIMAVNRIVQRHTDPFVQIAAAGIGGWIIGQALMNIAVVLDLAPVIGVPLPLVSSGGSSLVMSLTGIGVLMSFARREPGAPEIFAARPSLVGRSLAVMTKGRSRG